jgi:5'-methylthioadenosine phosphorylase
METPAEVRMLVSIGAQVVTHHFVPEAFLAKELELCYCAICYAVNYAETGSKHRPFASGELFGNLSQRSDRERLNATLSNMEPFLRQLAKAIAEAGNECECHQTMARNKGAYGLSDDWHKWFKS